MGWKIHVLSLQLFRWNSANDSGLRKTLTPFDTRDGPDTISQWNKLSKQGTSVFSVRTSNIAWSVRKRSRRSGTPYANLGGLRHQEVKSSSATVPSVFPMHLGYYVQKYRPYLLRDMKMLDHVQRAPQEGFEIWSTQILGRDWEQSTCTFWKDGENEVV